MPKAKPSKTVTSKTTRKAHPARARSMRSRACSKCRKPGHNARTCSA